MPTRTVLLNPGPVNISSRVRQALLRPDLCHREPECADLIARTRARLCEAFAPRDATSLESQSVAVKRNSVAGGRRCRRAAWASRNLRHRRAGNV
jgi:aspartate aminotransferase-like enzyme